MSNGFDDIAGGAAAEVDALFAAREAELIKDTTFNWEDIKPKLTDEAEYERLMGVVNQATEDNVSIGQLVTRLKGLAEGGVALADKVKTFVV